MAIRNHNRITGKAVGLSIGGVDYWADVKSWELAAEKLDGVTFADYATGGLARRRLKVSAIQSTDPTSFCMLIEKTVGKPVTLILAPHGNKTASESQPHYVVAVTVDMPPTLSAEAGDDKGSTFDIDLVCDSVSKKTTGSTLGTGNLTDALAG